jgi:hypothetical protein
MTRAVPALPGTLSRQQVLETGAHIAARQLPSGLIPWFEGHHADPWDHVESAMALSVCGLDDAALAAFAWSRENQAGDGSWPMEIDGAEVRDASSDTNQCAYLAVGVWHRWLVTGDRAFVDQMWPVVRRAVEFVVGLQLPMGAIAWARDGSTGIPHDTALLTGSACLVLSLRCGLALADLVDDPQPDWELSVGRLAHAVATHPEQFEDKSRYSMDWYYPVLGGAVTGNSARERLQLRWSEFVVPGRGIRCVDDAPWVTAAETCELVLVLAAMGDDKRAHALFDDVQFLRGDDGGYWTGWVFPDDAVWPEERSTWTGAAVVLAADALARCTPAHGLFRGDGLARLLEFDSDDCETCCRELASGLP